MPFLLKGINYLRSIRKRQDTITVATFIILIGTVLAKVVGLLKINAIARVYGVSADLDLFWAAFAIPDIIFNLLVIGSLNAALLPIFTQIKQKKPEEFNKVFSNVVSSYLLIVLGICTILFWVMPYLAGWLIHQTTFWATQDVSTSIDTLSEYRLQTLINLSQLLLVSPLILGLSAILGAALQAHKRFIAVSIAPLAYNVGTIIGLMGFILIAPQLGIYALALSTLIGTVAHLLVQLPSLFNQKIHYSFYLNFEDRDFRRIVKLTIPRSLGLAVEQVSIFFNTFWSFILGPGALSTFKYATSIYLLPVHIVGNSIAQAVFPTLAEDSQDRERFSLLYFNALEEMVRWSLPILMMTLVLRVPIVRLIIGSQRLTWEGTLLVAMVLAFLAPAILFQAIAGLNIRAFYAKHDTRSPFYISILGVIISVAASIAFSNLFSHYRDWRQLLQTFDWHLLGTYLQWFFTRGTSRSSVGGLAVGISLGLLFEIAASFWLLHRKLDLTIPFVGAMLKRIRIYFLASAIMALVMYFVLKFLDVYYFDTSRTLPLASLTAFTALIGALIYWVLAIRPRKN